MDNETQQLLLKMKLKQATLISLRDFENKRLISAKKTRSKVEYYWTCTPFLPLFILDKYPTINIVVYVDADLFFYSSLNIWKEMDNKSILITEHRYPKPQKYRIKKQGRFNVGILSFRNNKISHRCLQRWANQCIDWCYLREEDGKMGDQTYLNEWPKLYKKNIRISPDLGLNTGPWNVNNYIVKKKKQNIYVNNDKLTCYHFHQFRIFSHNSFSFAHGYDLNKSIIDIIYKPYIKQLNNIIKQTKGYTNTFSFYDNKDSKNYWFDWLKKLRVT